MNIFYPQLISYHNTVYSFYYKFISAHETEEKDVQILCDHIDRIFGGDVKSNFVCP